MQKGDLEVFPSENPDACSFRWELDMSDIMYTRQTDSPTFTLGGLSWKLEVDKSYIEFEMWLPCYLSLIDSDWECERVTTTIEFSIVNYNDNTKISKQRFTTHTHNEHSSGFRKFIEWRKLTERENGFSKNNKLMLSGCIRISNIINLRKLNRIDFFDSNEPRHDVSFDIDGETIYSNKAFLALHSPVFHKMFYGEFKERNQYEFKICNIDKEDFLELLRVMYPVCSKRITEYNVEIMLALADYYEIQKITELAETYLLNNDYHSITCKLDISEKYRLETLKMRCLDECITSKHIDFIEEHDEGYANLSEKMKMTLTEMKKVFTEKEKP